MANLKRNMLELVVEVKEGELVTKKFLTPVFIPLSVVYQALDLVSEMEKGTNKSEKEMLEKLIDFVTNYIYKGQFTKEELEMGLHGPEAVVILREQILFITQGYQSDETKKYLANKN
ncbi:hypothetical protein JOC75_004010 [Metabacillus crassostreae]|uniref:phage tail assembly chaperone G n=1 Tax=Metabacillus crassostreae TaxID=929098 RepID=UPI00195B5DF2|nr:hypothetical protein [Metabacillus crassostreae]MBM7605982.1 hypothetical protein [Metabacillus crassostreae]